MDLPSELIDAFRENRAAVFVGAGASVAAGLPNWDDLIVQLAREKWRMKGQLSSFHFLIG